MAQNNVVIYATGPDGKPVQVAVSADGVVQVVRT